MTVRTSGSLPVRLEQDVVLARQAVRRLAQDCGMRLIDQTKLVTAVSELARNTVVYGGGGGMDWDIIDERPRTGIPLAFRDAGPGDTDVELAMSDGLSVGGGPGLWLTGSMRLVDEFELDSTPGVGTRISIIRWS